MQIGLKDQIEVRSEFTNVRIEGRSELTTYFRDIKTPNKIFNWSLFKFIYFKGRKFIEMNFLLKYVHFNGQKFSSDSEKLPFNLKLFG